MSTTKSKQEKKKVKVIEPQGIIDKKEIFKPIYDYFQRIEKKNLQEFTEDKTY